MSVDKKGGQSEAKNELMDLNPAARQGLVSYQRYYREEMLKCGNDDALGQIRFRIALVDALVCREHFDLDNLAYKVSRNSAFEDLKIVDVHDVISEVRNLINNARIELPEVIELRGDHRERFENKIEQYRWRLKKLERGISNDDSVDRLKLSIRIGEEILNAEEGLEVAVLAKALKSELGEIFDDRVFVKVVLVLQAYAENAGEGLIGSRGF